ncbi:MAG: hypothetical protein RR216_06520, partial [Pseudoflavonifractor sp.]
MTTAEKHWNTWDPASFFRMEHLPSGLSILPGAFSEAEHAYSEFKFDDGTRLYEHDRDGRYCRMAVTHAHAEFELEYMKPDPWTVLLRMRNIVPPREWGLRYHMLATIGFSGKSGTMYRTSGGTLCGKTS